jgi:hypothetical protein
VPKTSFFLHQARTCWSLARITTDPWLKQRYEDWQSILSLRFMAKTIANLPLHFRQESRLSPIAATPTPRIGIIAPNLFRFSLHRWRGQVLDFEAVLRAP